MKYIIRFVAAVPMMSAGLSMMFSAIYAFDYPWFALLAIGNFFALHTCSSNYEDSVDSLVEYLRMLCDKTDEVA